MSVDEAFEIAYDETLSIEEREQKLLALDRSDPRVAACISGYMEALSMERMARDAQKAEESDAPVAPGGQG